LDSPAARPRPLLALVLAQTLRHGAREGCKIALTPLVTDAPIIIVALCCWLQVGGTPSAARPRLHRRGRLCPVSGLG